MKFSSYFYTSLAATAAITAHAVITREQFYPTILFLVTSKVSFVVLSNMAIASILLVGRISQFVFLGTLRDVEVEQLVERGKYTITETCLALAVFRNELSPPILALFCVLLFLKAFHWLSKLRIDYLEQIMPVTTSTHVRLVSLICLLFACDIWAANSCIQYTFKNQRSVLILFGFEFGLLVGSVFNLICRYILHVIDSRLTNGLVSKGLCVMLIDLICDAFRILTYSMFFYLVLINYGVPLHILREMFMAFNTFQRKFMSFIRYVQLTKNLDNRLENASPEDIAAAGDCLICREGMDNAKKLPCGHVFHLDCLRMWLQHQQSCPLCRAEIPVTPSTADNTNAPGGDGGNEHNHPVGDEANPAFEEARILAEAVQGLRNRALAGGGTGVGGGDTPDSGDKCLPSFFVVTSTGTVEVRSAPSNNSPLVRPLNKGAVIFVTERLEGHLEADSMWLQVPDGYVRERGILFGALGPPSVVPFDPTSHQHKSQTASAHTKRPQAFEDLLPQPAVSAIKCSLARGRENKTENKSGNKEGSSNVRGTGGIRGSSPRRTGTNIGATEWHGQVPEQGAGLSEAESLLDTDDDEFDMEFLGQGLSGPDSYPLGPGTEGSEFRDKTVWIDEQITTHATAAAKLLKSAFGDPIRTGSVASSEAARRDFKSVGTGWGVGTSLDKMIAMQAQIEHFATSLEGLHDTVTTCQVVLSQLVDDQVKQYQKIHELRRAVAGRNMGSSMPGDYFFEFSCGRGGNAGTNSFPTAGAQSSPSLESAGLRTDVSLGTGTSSATSVNTATATAATTADSIISQASVTAKGDSDVPIEDRTLDLDTKVEVDNMLDHSSGAALFERLLYSRDLTEDIEKDELAHGWDEEEEMAEACFDKVGTKAHTDEKEEGAENAHTEKEFPVDLTTSVEGIEAVTAESEDLNEAASECINHVAVLPHVAVGTGDEVSNIPSVDPLKEVAEILANKYRKKLLEDQQKIEHSP